MTLYEKLVSRANDAVNSAWDAKNSHRSSRETDAALNDAELVRCAIREHRERLDNPACD